MNKYRCFMDFEYTTTGDNSFDRNNDGIEVISIAGVVIDENDNTIDEFHEIIRPIKNIILHPYCTQLTGITQDMVDEADFFSSVADKFMKFIDKYMKHDLYIYVWGNFDVDALDRTFNIHRYNGEFKYIRDKIVNIQKRICCSIRYKNNIIRSVWNLQSVKMVYYLPISTKQHNALYDARDLRDVFLAYKNNSPKNKKLIYHFYERAKAQDMVNAYKKVLFFDCIPGEFKYGLAKLFQNAEIEHNNVDNLKFNKKTLVFENYNYSVEGIKKADSELIRYSNIQLITEIKNKTDYIDGYAIEKPVFYIYLTAKSKKNDTEYLINTVHNIPIHLKNLHHVFVFCRTMKKYDKLYDVNSKFKDVYSMSSKFM